MSSIFRISLTLGMLVPLAACQTTRTTAIDKAVCAIWTPVTYSGSKDTPETVASNRALNAKRDAYCRK